MPTYSAITDASIAPQKPFTNAIATAMRDNPISARKGRYRTATQSITLAALTDDNTLTFTSVPGSMIVRFEAHVKWTTTDNNTSLQFQLDTSDPAADVGFSYAYNFDSTDQSVAINSTIDSGITGALATYVSHFAGYITLDATPDPATVKVQWSVGGTGNVTLEIGSFAILEHLDAT